MLIFTKSIHSNFNPFDRFISRYQTMLHKTYVDDIQNLKWCPFPNCTNAVQCKVTQNQLEQIVPSVECSAHHHFCFGCSLAEHQPATCTVAKLWLKKCADDSETANWIAAHTKECPKCNSTIEKNGGCNHMTCKKCKYEVQSPHFQDLTCSFAGSVMEIGLTMVLLGIPAIDMKKRTVSTLEMHKPNQEPLLKDTFM